MKNITENIKYIGVNDYDIDLFEGQYVVPNGMAYNSYLIKDEEIAIIDGVDNSKLDEWIKNVENELEGANPDYFISLHMEPDHSGSGEFLINKYPDMKIVGNKKTFTMMNQFFDFEIPEERKIIVGEGEEISLGNHNLTFAMAPMVHWPEVMVAYESKEKILFSADAFGKFGALDVEEDWACEARRYYFNIVGKYGAQVQALLKKVEAFDIKIICPLHGPILDKDLDYYIEKYNVWSSFEPEDKGIFIAYASIYGNTKKAAIKFKEMLEEKTDVKVSICDLARDDMAEALEDAFRYDRLVLAAASYDGGVFPCMESFLHHLKSKLYQKRKVAIIENGSWGPTAGRTMKQVLDTMKDITVCEKMVTIKSAMNEKTIEDMKELIEELI